MFHSKKKDSKKRKHLEVCDEKKINRTLRVLPGKGIALGLLKLSPA